MDIKEIQERVSYAKSTLEAGKEILLEIIKTQQKELKEKDLELEMKDKMIDILAVQLIGLVVWNDKKDDAIIFKNKEEVKQYFERKVENE